jgi:hypothetical protein
VTEYQRHRLACPRCGDTPCAALPPGVPAGQSGPRLVAFAGLLMAYFRQSKRRTALFLEALLKQPCRPALTLKMQAQVIISAFTYCVAVPRTSSRCSRKRVMCCRATRSASDFRVVALTP